MNSCKIIIIGGIGTAVNIAEQIIDAATRYGSKDEFLGYAFDDESFGSEINGYPLLCKTYDAYEKYKQYKDVKFIYQLYRPDLLRERSDLLYSFNIPVDRFYNFVHPTALVLRSAQLGHGNAIQANCVVNSNTILGNHNTLNTSCLIGHDTIVGDNNFFSAQSCIGSNVKMGDCVFVGLNAAINNMIEINSNVMVGMSSNVTKSIKSNRLVYGNPAKVIREI